jgi:hypothetical protein
MAIHSYMKKDLLFQVFYDEVIVNDCDFESLEQEQEYLSRFERGELKSYTVTASKKCKCCNQWEFIDSYGPIHASTLEEFLKEVEGWR